MQHAPQTGKALHSLSRPTQEQHVKSVACTLWAR